MQLNYSLSTHFSTPIIHGSNTQWRIRARLAVRGSPLKIGLFKPGTHEVEDLIDCPDHHPAINKALKIIRTQKIIPFNEETLTGSLRYIQLTVSRQNKKVQLVLVSNGSYLCDDLAKNLKRVFDWHSIWINIQEGSTNTILGSKWIHIYGPKYLEENLLGEPTFFHPACFIQSNLDLYEKILLDIKSQILPGKITELYAGVGSISRVIDRPSILIESNPYAEKSFYHSNPPPYLKFITGNSEDHIDLFQDILIVDPPRKGLHPKILSAIKDSHLKQILYLSCNPISLQRDLNELETLGWKIVDLKRYLLFPNTPHVEILVNLFRNQ